MSYNIEKSVPIPPKWLHMKSKYPFKEMEIGDSFTFEIPDRDKVASAASIYMKRNPGEYFTIRKESNVCRIWKVEPSDNK